MMISSFHANDSGIRRFLTMDFRLDEACFVKQLFQILWRIGCHTLHNACPLGIAIHHFYQDGELAALFEHKRDFCVLRPLWLWRHLLLMFCYDPVFLGQDHPVTIILALVSLVSSILMLKKELHIAVWGRNIRYALATVIVFWTFVEIMARNGFFNEIWVDPMNHIREMTIILAVFIIVVVLTIFSSKYITTE